MASEKDRLLLSLDEHIPLDARSPVPLYHQMEQILIKRITDEKAVGAMLPPEKDLMRIFSVSRATVKKTMDNLVDIGLVERRRALGTRVIRQEITEDLGRLKGYTEEMQSRGLQVRTKLIGVTRHLPDEYVREKLQIGPGEETVCIRRLRGTTKVFPIVALQSEIPVSFGIPEDEDFGGSLYRLIEEKYRIPIEWAEQEIRSRKATEREAELLEINPGDGVLVMERRTVTRDNRFIEFVRGVYRPDHYSFSIRLRR